MTYKTSDEMKEVAFATSLGSDFAADVLSVNKGYPVLGWQLSSRVYDLISQIDDTITLESGAAITAARAAYDKLRDEEKAKISNYSVLTAAETQYNKLKNVYDLIEAIPEDITLDAQSSIAKARTAYDNLSTTERKKITNFATLSEAEAQYAKLKNVYDLIEAIPDSITLDSKTAIEAARAAYDALSAAEKSAITNYSTLENAEAALKKLMEEEESGISTKVEGGEATTTIEEEAAEKIAENIKEGGISEITISAIVDTKETVTEAEVTIPAVIVNTAGSTGTEITVETNVGSVSLDKETIKTIAEANAGSIKLDVAMLDESTDKSASYEITLETIKNGVATKVSDLGGTAEFTVALPTGLASSDEPTSLYIDGSYAEPVASETAEGKVKMILTHFSKYAVMSQKDADLLLKASAESTTMGALSLKAYKSDKIKASWKNGKGNTAGIISYQVYRSTDKKFRKSVKKYTAKSKTLTMTKSMKKGKRYYVKVRAKIKLNGKYYYSKWSAARSVKCLKTRR